MSTYKQDIIDVRCDIRRIVQRQTSMAPLWKLFGWPEGGEKGSETIRFRWFSIVFHIF